MPSILLLRKASPPVPPKTIHTVGVGSLESGSKSIVVGKRLSVLCRGGPPPSLGPLLCKVGLHDGFTYSSAPRRIIFTNVLRSSGDGNVCTRPYVTNRPVLKLVSQGAPPWESAQPGIILTSSLWPQVWVPSVPSLLRDGVQLSCCPFDQVCKARNCILNDSAHRSSVF